MSHARLRKHLTVSVPSPEQVIANSVKLTAIQGHHSQFLFMILDDAYRKRTYEHVDKIIIKDCDHLEHARHQELSEGMNLYLIAEATPTECPWHSVDKVEYCGLSGKGLRLRAHLSRIREEFKKGPSRAHGPEYSQWYPGLLADAFIGRVLYYNNVSIKYQRFAILGDLSISAARFLEDCLITALKPGGQLRNLIGGCTTYKKGKVTSLQYTAGDKARFGAAVLLTHQINASSWRKSRYNQYTGRDSTFKTNEAEDAIISYGMRHKPKLPPRYYKAISLKHS